MVTKRSPAVAGMFYESDPYALRNQLDKLFALAVSPEPGEEVRALILPHAGYQYSGNIAASGVSQLPREVRYKRIFLIGSSHRMGFDGASVYKGDYFATPLGGVPVDVEAARELIINSPFFGFGQEPHVKEHSLEVQLPFLQYHLKNPFHIVPILIGTRDQSTCREIAKVLKPWFTPDNLFVVSTDFSHYPHYDDARTIDRETVDAILLNDPDVLTRVLAEQKKRGISGLDTPLCGWSSVFTLLHLTSTYQDIRFRHIQYANSGDSIHGEKESVVGYNAIVAVKDGFGLEHFALSEEIKKELLVRARSNIMDEFNRISLQEDDPNVSEVLWIKTGAFVSVYRDGELAGCIGHIGNDQPLWQVVDINARAAAFKDSRFMPLRQEEMEGVKIEISVLTPLKRVMDIQEIQPGKHGVFIKKDEHHGTFLPQVAGRMNWDTIELLRRCAKDKAGLNSDGWKDAEIYTYEAITFKEE
jgi:MEMO1 family protein